MIYCMSDLHGQYEQYAAMLEKLRLGDDDQLFVLGDVIDRGPEGVQILQDMMMRPNVIPILGNHELMAAVCLPWLLSEVTEESLDALDAERFGALQDWLANGGLPTIGGMRRLSREEQQDILDYIREMELYAQIQVGERCFVLVHGGIDHFSPDRALEDYQLEDFLFCRPELDKVYYEDRYLVYGHTPTRLLWKAMGRPEEDRIIRRGGQIAIDCGCGFGGALGCLCLDTLEEFYV